MSNYLDRGFSMPYQIAKNRYREQIFGHEGRYNYDGNQRTPDPYPERPVQSAPGSRRGDGSNRNYVHDQRKPLDRYGAPYDAEGDRQHGYDRDRPPDGYRPAPKDRPPEGYGQGPPRPGAQAGYDQTPRHREPERYDQGQRQGGYDQGPGPGQREAYEETPRRGRVDEQRPYKGDRPDLGPVDYNSPSRVPYPQEPDRRRRQNDVDDRNSEPPSESREPDRRRHQNDGYMQPPEIGFDPYKDPEPVKEKNNSKLDDQDDCPNPGWLMLLRFHKDGLFVVQRALTMSQKHIESDGGRILGIARSYGVRIREGGDDWVKLGRMQTVGGEWGVSKSPANEDTSYCVLVIFYQSLSRAIEWLDRDHQFKQKDFPANNPLDCIVLPVSASANTPYTQTLVMTEYQRISHPEYFRDKFSIPTENLMRQRYRASPYVVKACSLATEDHRQRVARHLRGSWIKRNSVITVSLFESVAEVHKYFKDTEYVRAKECQDKVCAPTTIVMDIEDWHEPYKYVPGQH